jgi:hypothetical protein
MDLPHFDGHPVSWRYNLKREGVFLMLKDRPMYSLGVLGLEAVRLVKLIFDT